jgi:hypothetical protein
MGSAAAHAVQPVSHLFLMSRWLELDVTLSHSGV